MFGEMRPTSHRVNTPAPFRSASPNGRTRFWRYGAVLLLAAGALCDPSNVVIASTAGAAAEDHAPPHAPFNGSIVTPRPGESRDSWLARRQRPSETPAPALSADSAVVAARAAVAACGDFHVAIAIIDAAGLPKLYYVADGTAGHHAYIAYRKANSALLIGAPSEEIEARMKTDSSLADRAAGNDTLVPWAGGVPIYSGETLLGAIGVSGAEPSAVDRRCAEEGLRAIATTIKGAAAP